MMAHYCPEHKGIARCIIDTFPGRCGDCCEKSNKAGFKHGDGDHKCPRLLNECEPEMFADMHARKPFTDEEYVLHKGKYFVDAIVLMNRRSGR